MTTGEEDCLASLQRLASPCRLCPRACGVARDRGEKGFCGVGAEALLASAAPHFGEEPCLVGRGGSGTLFLAGCNLGCRFCQNWEISQGRTGEPATPAELARVMLRLQERGCVNINWVTPTHLVHRLVEALLLARRDGLTLPLVYNCGGYESLAALRLLAGVVEIYMPDLKSLDPAFGAAALQAPDYPERARAALVEMQRQVGDLELDECGIARKGLLVRHLVMPGRDAGPVLEFLAREISPRCAVNVMGQYHPAGRAREVPGLERSPSREEVQEARERAFALGLRLL